MMRMCSFVLGLLFLGTACSVASEKENVPEKEANLIGEEKLKEDWEKNYELEVRVYSLRNLSPAAAKSLIDQQLKIYYFCDAITFGRSFIQARDLTDEGAPSFTEKSLEQAVADEKPNAVIVTAIPKTHEKIEKLLAEMDAILEAKEQASIPERYRMQMILLRGVQQSEERKAPTGLDRTVQGLSVSDLPLTEIVRLLSRLSGTEMYIEPTVPPDLRVALKFDEPKSVKKILEDVAVQYDLNIERWPELVRIKPSHEVTPIPIPSPVRITKASDPNGLDTIVKDITVNESSVAYFVNQFSDLIQWTIIASPETRAIEMDFDSPNAKSARAVLDDIAQIYDLVIEHEAGQTLVWSEKEYRESMGKRPENTAPRPLADYGLSKQDLEIIGFQSAEELGRGVVDLAGAKGEEGEAYLSLNDNYAFELEFMDLREPYLVAKGRFLEKDEEKPLLENTLYLEPEKPSLLGLTNLREALILVVKRLGD